MLSKNIFWYERNGIVALFNKLKLEPIFVTTEEFDRIKQNICGGGCAHSARLLEGSIDKLDKGFCLHSKTMLEFLIWDLYEKMLMRHNACGVATHAERR